MKELIDYNKGLLEVASKRLDLLISATYDQNHPQQYFDAVNRQVDYINLIEGRIAYLNEREIAKVEQDYLLFKKGDTNSPWSNYSNQTFRSSVSSANCRGP